MSPRARKPVELWNIDFGTVANANYKDVSLGSFAASYGHVTS